MPAKLGERGGTRPRGQGCQGVGKKVQGKAGWAFQKEAES